MNTTLIFAIAIFALGVVSGLVVIVCIGIYREERDFRRTGLVSITRLAPGRVSQGTRALTGLFTRQHTDLTIAAAGSGRSQQEDPMRQLTVMTALAEGRR